MKTISVLLAIVALLVGCAVLTSTPDAAPKETRLSHFPTKDLPTSGRLEVRWDDYMVPFILAEKDDDVPFALGLVHAHLRIAQLELMRFASQGRLSELAGPFATAIDKTLRIFNFGKAVPETIAAMPPETKRWAERFVEGINTYVAQNPKLIPADLQVMGIRRLTPWTLAELVTVWKLASIDVNWLVYFSFLKQYGRPSFDSLWKTVLDYGAQSVPSFSSIDGKLGQLLFNFTKTGSNSLVVGKKKSKTGSGWIANDPHLGLTIPGTWLIAGYRSPSHRGIGMMIPSLPFLALGRNESIAWGGTNMWGLSTHLYALSDAEAATAVAREEKISVRNWFDTSIVVRDTQWGPILSDSPLFKGELKPIAVRWMGHEISDEITAFLKASHASNFAEFRDAFRTYAVSAQNMLVADKLGNIGHVLAYRQPLRPDMKNKTLLQPTANAWSGANLPTQLPFAFNPPEGYIASANNRPTPTRSELGWFYQSSDRVKRWKQLTESQPMVDLASLQKWQMDTYSSSSFELKEELKSRLSGGDYGALTKSALWIELASWDGYYDEKSRGPVAFEILVGSLARSVLGKQFPDEDALAILLRSTSWKAMAKTRLKEMSSDEIAALLIAAVKELTPNFEKFPTWGDMHRVAAAHLLANVPLIGGRYKFSEFGASGGADTIFKTSTGLSGRKETSSYGTNARHISDLSNIDENYFVLFGGQDGWLVSPNTLDQIPLWREGKYLRLPLSEAGVLEVFKVGLKLTGKAS